MEITTNHSRLEHFRLQIYLLPRSKTLWVMGFLIWALLFYLMFSRPGATGEAACTFCALFVAFVLSTIEAMLLMLAISAIGVLISVLSAGLLPGVLGEHKFILREDGLFEATDVNETLAKWKGIRSIKRYKKYIIVWIGTGIYPIPRKCFAGQDQFEEFGTQLYESWQANK